MCGAQLFSDFECRLKANRNAKRKARPTDEPSKTSDDRPAKRPRTSQPSAPKSAAVDAAVKQAQTQARPPGQIISSLFSSNPRVEAPAPEPIKKKPAATPSNAPLTDSSSFVGLGLDPLLASHLSSKMEIAKPTSIQSATLSAIATPANHERDLFIQSQTGSGKTLAFLLPIIQDLLPLGKLSYIDRSIGTLAIIIAPTRELAKQISEVLEALLKLRLRAENESADDADAPRLTRWMVSGLLIGGSTRTHEKAKLRKGVPILVSTPGRLLDHLQNTASFDVGKCRWLVLDEADRLMELGFEESITGIIKGLDGRRKLALKANEEGIGNDVGGWDWERQRRTILCSATIREDVQKLSGKALVNPVMIRGALADASLDSTIVPSAKTDEQFTPPSQLLQKYVVVPLKLRLVVLVALLRYLLAQAQTQKGTKIIVFLSCTDSVDFHWNLLGGLSMADDLPEGSDSDSDVETQTKPDKSLHQQVEIKSSILPDTSIFRLHGSLPTHTRLASLKQFSNKSQSGQSAILLCTSVASRGLDLPLVRAVVQYDLPTEGGATEYVHRVGRTARAGKGGEAWAVVAPSESEWVKWVEKHMQSQGKITMQGSSVENLLKLGFGGQGRESEERATEIQLSLERWVLSRTKVIDTLITFTEQQTNDS